MATHIRFPGVEIFDLDDPKEREEARAAFTAKGDALLELIFGQQLPDSKSLVLEREYVDREYASAYAEFYARAFHEYRRRTMRFHFFESRISFRDLLDERLLAKSYRGYLIATADPPRVGRSALAPPSTLADDNAFVLGAGRFEANLCGTNLTVTGVPFIAQDGRIAACASAAIWMSARSLSVVSAEGQRLYSEEGARTASLSDITKFATHHSLGASGEPLLAPGLNIEQMLVAIRELGYSPVVYAPRDAAEARDIIYWHVESQIAPILVVSPRVEGGSENAGASYHAIVAVGHTYAEEASLPEGPTLDITSSRWVPRFICHDDQMGPYHTFSVEDHSGEQGETVPHIIVESTGNGPSVFGHDWFYHQPAELSYIVVPLPNRVFLRAEDAEQKARDLLEIAYVEHGVLLPPRRVFRSYLTRANSFKHRLHAEATPGLSRELAELYRGRLLPRFVWVVELMSLEGRQGKQVGDLRVEADVTIDATSGTDRLDFVTMRIPGFFMAMNPEEVTVIPAIRDRAVVAQQEPFASLVREPAGRDYLP